MASATADSQNTPRWFFPILSGGEESGLNDAGIETFKKAERLAREITQNVLDNRHEGKRAADEPAIVTFEYLDLPIEDFPGFEQFTTILESCRDHVLSQFEDGEGAGNEKIFFENALALLKNPTIPTMRAGDENTTGLRGGDDERSGSFWRLLRGQGYSQLQGPGGGTYGIGQRAPFAHSALRTIVYATRLDDGAQAFIGKSILASFPRPDDGTLTQNKGWWCLPSKEGNDWGTIRESDRMPARYRRNVVGTDLYVVGYQRADWERRVRWSVLEHFFGAIDKGDLNVRLMKNGELIDEITSDNLENKLLLACEEARNDLPIEEYQKGLGASLYFFRALRSPVNGAPFEKEIDKLGTVKLYVHRDPEAPDRWCSLRQPRILVERHGASILRGFAAVFLCDNPEGNRYLARLEDPAHVRWHEDEARGWTDAEKAQARTVRLEITRFVREVLKALLQEGQPEEQDVPDLGRFLPEEEAASEEQGVGAALDPTGEHTDRETGLPASREAQPPINRKLSRRTRAGPGVRQLGGGGTDTGGGGRRRRSKKKGGRRKRGGSGDDQTLRPSAVRFRSFLEDEGSYRVILEAEDAVMGDARLVAVGEDSDYPIEIKSAKDDDDAPIQVAGNRLKKLKLEAGTPLRLRVCLRTEIPLCLALGS